MQPRLHCPSRLELDLVPVQDVVGVEQTGVVARDKNQFSRSIQFAAEFFYPQWERDNPFLSSTPLGPLRPWQLEPSPCGCKWQRFKYFNRLVRLCWRAVTPKPRRVRNATGFVNLVLDAEFGQT
jgi:hypothetical protein